MRYLWWIFIPSFFFGLQQDGTFYHTVVSLGFIHFAAELQPVYYLIFASNLKIAKRLTIITFFIVIVQAIAVWIIPAFMFTIFSLQFVMVDTATFLAAITFIFHPNTNDKLIKMCLAFSIHYIGVTWNMFIQIISFYYDKASKDSGFGWITIICSSLLQLYLLKDIIQKNIHIEIPKLTVTEKFALLGIWLFVGLLLVIFATFRTTKSDDIDWDKIKWGDSFEIMIVRIAAPFTMFIGTYTSCYYYKFASTK